MKKASIFLFGDSVTRGSFDAEAGGWAERLKTLANAVSIRNDFQPIVTVFNLGIGGNDTNDLLKRFKFETEQRMTKGGEAFFVFSFGTNDAAFLVGKKEYAVTQDQYRKNLLQIINEARSFSNNIIFLTSPPVIDEITNGVSLVGKSRKNSSIEAYNACLSEICMQEKVDIIDIYESFMSSGRGKGLFVNDGLHPNASGHVLIFNDLKKYFEGKAILLP